MKDFIKTMDTLPWIVKMILCLPALDIVWNIVRLLKSYTKNNTVGLILALVLLIVGVPFMWLIDLACVFLNGKIWWID